MTITRKRIFISSVQNELAVERQAIKGFMERDPLLRRFFTVFLFEDLPASDHRADEVYIAELDKSDLYLGIFGNDYGFEDSEGVSPTEREFDHATATGILRLIYVKGSDDTKRHPKMRSLIGKAGQQLIRRRFADTHALTDAIYSSLVDYLAECGAIQSSPFEERPCASATLDDIDSDAVASFMRSAREERQFPLQETTPVHDLLAHLHLLSGNQPTNAAILLFGRDPQQFFPAAEVRCMHFHGTEIERPVPFYRIYKGTIYEQVDTAVDFVLSKINRSVGTRAESIQAPVRYEIPPDVIREAVVNAIAHRDYTSAGAVQVSVFSDRVEVWNPGNLTPPLTPESLRHPHGSVARNPRICEALFLARYIEKYGTGTLMMIRESLAHDLPEPDFIQRGGEFTTTIWRDWLTPERLARFNLNERQVKAIGYMKTRGEISNSEYQELTGSLSQTALRDLRGLVSSGIVEKLGKTGRNARYRLRRKADINTTNPT